MDSILVLCLREIQIECYRQIAIEQRGGRAIQEEELDPYPNKADYIMLEDYSLDQLVADTQAASAATEDPQIDIEEAIEAAETTSETSAPRSKMCAYFSAIREWHLERKEKEYKYECAKTKCADRVYGFEYMAKFIDRFIGEYNKNQPDQADQRSSI